MMWSRENLKTQAKSILKANYWKAVLVSLFLAFATGGSSAGTFYNSFHSLEENSYEMGSFHPQTLILLMGIMLSVILVVTLFGGALKIFLFSPLEVSCDRLYIAAYKSPADLNLLGFAFKNSYMNIVKVQFLRHLFVWLWSLLLIVPGIIKHYEYLMIPFLLAENPGMNHKEAFARSKEMMTGEKWNTFVLHLSFFGWHFLSVFTCGLLGLFYVNPYYDLTRTGLYEVLKLKIQRSNPYQPPY